MKIEKVNYLKNNLYQNKVGIKESSANTNVFINSDVVLNFLSARNIFFKGNFNKTSFEESINNNWFKLPKIKTKNGATIQAMPDKTQLKAAGCIYNNNSVVCIAPTGTGKTAIANYAISKNMEEGKRTIYTTPLKALSNDKYREFSKIYGAENVGLLTGDIKLKPNAPIVIMTTEIYRNMALSNWNNNGRDKFKDVRSVIFDEAHYIADKERGTIWEESIMLTPKDIQIIPLSATIGNGEEFAHWIQNNSDIKVNLVEASPKDRHVPLIYYNWTGNSKNPFQELIKGKVDVNSIASCFEQDKMSQRQVRALDMLYQAKHGEDDNFCANDVQRKEIIDDLKNCAKYKVPHEQFSNIIRKNFRLKELKAQEITQLLIDSESKSINENLPHVVIKDDKKDSFKNIVRDLKNTDKLPALIFIFSRSRCNDMAAILADSSLNLTTQEEKEEIKAILKKYKQQGIYLGSDFNEHELIQGVAVHHAGLLPSYKKLVEELFSKKLVKTVFATSTLSAGINMPAKTVVVTSIDRPFKNEFGEIEYQNLSSNEFHQMTGRAGRRGIDTIGNVVLYNLKEDDVTCANSLILQAPDKAKSSYSPSFSFLASYYQTFHNDDILSYFQNNTLKVFQSNDKEKTKFGLFKEFEKYKKVLLETGFIENSLEGIRTTTKGKMLAKSHGYNNLTLTQMIQNGDLKDLNAVELASFAASMTAEKEVNEEKSDVAPFVDYLTQNTVDYDNQSPLIEALDKALDIDLEFDKAKKEADISIAKENKTGIFEACMAYIWANKNSDDEKDSILNFKTLSNEFMGKKSKAALISPIMAKKFEDGNLYRILADTTDVLKQIINICEYALESGDFEDYEYYENLIKTSEKSLELIKKPPIHDALNIE